MRRLVVLTFVTLDGVMQAPGGTEEDPSGGFKHGGWSFPYFDEFMGKVMGGQTGHTFDLLLGRRTYEIFASYWPLQDEKTTPFAAEANRAHKYVASHSPLRPEWKNSQRLEGDVVEEVRRLKSEEGPELQVHGSSNLIQTLLKNDLVDELWLKIFPVTLGGGKRLFAEGTIPTTFALHDSTTSPKGVIIANYVRAGEVKTGSF